MRRRHKYAAVRTEIDGIGFASKREGQRYADLKLKERAGLIRDIEIQPVFNLILKAGRSNCSPRAIKTPKGHTYSYRADFRYHDVELDRQVVEDVKGYDTPLSALKRAVVEAIYGITIEVVK